MAAGIYRIYFIGHENKCYVGQTIDLKRREFDHRWALEHNQHYNKHLQAAYNKYGKENFIFEVLEIIEIPLDHPMQKVSKDFLCPPEQKWIDYYNSADTSYGYNFQPTSGSPLGVKNTWTKEHLGGKTFEEIYGPERAKELKENLRLKNLGKPQSEEHRRKNSESNKGHKVSPETRKKQREAKIGKPFSKEHRKKLSDAKKGKKQPQELIQKRVRALTGHRPWSKGQKRTEEQKQKMRDAQKERRSKEKLEKHGQLFVLICSNCNNLKGG